MFAGNVGVDGIVFPKSHPYYKAPKSVAKEVEKVVEKKLGSKGKRGVALPQGTPVSRALTTKVKVLKPVVDRTLAAIDKVHGDGALQSIIVKASKSNKFYGAYTSQWTRAFDIAINTAMGDHKHLTLAHEIGHWLDHIGLGQSAVWGTTNRTQEMRAFFDSVLASKEHAKIKAVVDSATITGADGVVVKLNRNSRAYTYYVDLLDPKELWARSYAQYIATRSGDEVLLAELARETKKANVFKQWDDDDFAPIASSIDVLFKSKGWQTK